MRFSFVKIVFLPSFIPIYPLEPILGALRFFVPTATERTVALYRDIDGYIDALYIYMHIYHPPPP